MKTKLLILSLLISAAASAGNIYYMQTTADQWKNKPADKVITANNTSALTALQSGDEVWLTGGDYQFTVSSVQNITLRGGFKGTESKTVDRCGGVLTTINGSFTQDKWNFDAVRLTGDVTLNGDITMQNVIVSSSKNIVVQGGSKPELKDGKLVGGARITGCWFYGNNTPKAVLICHSAVISSCSFVNNHSRYSGGALDVRWYVYVENCFFYNNKEGNSNFKRDIYAGNCYKAERDVNGNLMSGNPTEYGTNTEYKHSDEYITMGATECTLKQKDGSPFIDKGAVRVDMPEKTYWGVNRICDKIDIGCAEFQKIMAHLDGVVVQKPSFIKEGWSVVDTAFAINSGLDCYYMPKQIVCFNFKRGNYFLVNNWHFTGDDNPTKDLPWSLESSDTVRYETAGNIYDTLHITATQLVDTFKLSVITPLTAGVKSVSMEPSKYNTSLADDKKSSKVYAGEEVTLKVSYDTTHYHFSGWFSEYKCIGRDTVQHYKVASVYGYGQHNEQKIYALVSPDTIKVTYSILPDVTYGNVFTDPVDINVVRYGDTIRFSQVAAAGKRFKCWLDEGSVTVDTIKSQAFSMVVDREHSYTAIFEDIHYTVNAKSSVKGKQTTDPMEGIAELKGAGNQFLYDNNTTLSVQTKPGYKLVGWLCPQFSNDTIKTETLTINGIRQDYDVTVCLKQQMIKVSATVEPSDWKVTIKTDSSEGLYYYGDTAHITVSDTLRMEAWQKRSGSKWYTYAAPCKQVDIMGVEEDWEIRALYNSNIMLVNVASADTAMGTATVDGTFKRDQWVTFKATPKEGYEFVRWETSDGTVMENPAEFSCQLTQDMSLKAFFKPKDFNVEVEVYVPNHPEFDPSGDVSVTQPETVSYGQQFTLSTEGSTAVEFLGWVDTDNPSDTIKKATVVIEKAVKDYSFHAVYNHREFKVTLRAEPIEWPVTLSQTNEDGKYFHGDTLTVSTTDTLRMYSWFYDEGGSWKGLANPAFDVIINGITENLDIIAAYSDSMKIVKFEINKPELGYVECVIDSGNAFFWKGVGVTATTVSYVNTKTRFVNWTSNEEEISTENPLVFKVTQDSTIVANIEIEEPTAAPDAASNEVSEQQKPYKTIINNQVIIVVGNRRYNLLGVPVE